MLKFIIIFIHFNMGFTFKQYQIILNNFILFLIFFIYIFFYQMIIRLIFLSFINFITINYRFHILKFFFKKHQLVLPILRFD